MITSSVMEKMVNYGTNVISSAELVSLIIGNGVKGKSAVDIAEGLIKNLPQENIYYLSETWIDDLMKTTGIGKKSATALIAAVELGRRIQQSRVKINAKRMDRPDVVADYLMPRLRSLDHEEFWGLFLNTQLHLIKAEMLTSGSIDSSIANPREVLRRALKYNAKAVIIAHNHPSGWAHPSREDIAVTNKIIEAGKIVGIDVLDHIVIGDGTYVSLKDQEFI